MKLPFGNYQNELIHISEVQSGRTDLACPNCGQSLIAKKGKLKEHHFAHDGASCTATFSKDLFGLSNRLPTKLPLCIYAQKKNGSIENKLTTLQKAQETASRQDQTIEELQTRLDKLFDYFKQKNVPAQANITSNLIKQVHQFLHQKIAPFPTFHLLRDPVFKTGYTDGKIIIPHPKVLGEDQEYFYPLVFQPYVLCLQQYHDMDKLVYYTTQIQSYKKELVRFQQFQLYFLEIQIPTATIYKIGLTARPITKRLKEIEQELQGYFNKVTCKVLVLKKEVAFLENFFKRKYDRFQFPIGTLTEYFRFPPTLLDFILQDFDCVNLKDIPKRNNPIWLYWAFFHSNGKLYGGQTKYLFVNGERYQLTTLEKEKIDLLQF